ncbi:MAG: hypothetical protein A2007_05930 [Verrucomicrobia bacterium GWC2_42_7]|nr:MAG: hypothetical protein A2007_05930 [Verrucomicrobia bacterium GWC2_42_7]
MKRLLKYIFSLGGLLIIFLPLQAESLWLAGAKSTNERSLFASKTAAKVGDILVVDMGNNTIDAVISGAKFNVERKINEDNNNTTAKYLWNKFADKVLKSPGLKDITGSNKNETSVDVDDNYTLKGKITVAVTDLLPNGNLVVEGATKKQFSSGEKRYEVVRGIVRPDDIGNDNVVLSEKIYDLQVQFLSEGQFSNSQRKGWANEIGDAIQPF